MLANLKFSVWRNCHNILISAILRSVLKYFNTTVNLNKGMDLMSAHANPINQDVGNIGPVHIAAF
ncbi:MAG: hypothetical protein ACI8WB_002010, partial [Phenylobacterium sp.]